MNKKTFCIIATVVCLGIVLMLLSACGQTAQKDSDGDDISSAKFYVIFKVDGAEYERICTAGNEEITLPVRPSKKGYVFDGWYLDNNVWTKAFTAQSLLNQTLSEDITVYAKWNKEQEKPISESYLYTQTSEGLIITGYTGNATELTIPSKIDGLIVVGIGDYAFSGCKGLTSVTIPDSVASIGESAFSGCSGLTEVTIPFVGDKANKTSSDTYQYPFGYIFGTSSYSGGVATRQYYYGSSTSSTTSSTYYIPATLKKVTVTGGEILDGAFSYCFGLTSVSIGSGVTSIGYGAFSGCRGLTSVSIGSGVTSIGDWAFNGCSGLTSIIIPDSVTSIGDDAFYSCYKLIEVYNKSSLSITAGSTDNGAVAYYAKNVYTAEGGSRITDTADGFRFFYDGTEAYLLGYYGSETDITLPESFTAYDGTEATSYSVYKCAFDYNINIMSVTIPNSVTSIGDDAFSYCSGLTSIIIPDSVTSIGDYAFRACSKLTSVSIGSGVTSIGYGAFKDCNNIQTATIPAIAISKIPKNSLKTVIINGGTEIANNAFSYCRGLTSVSIPDSVTSIGDRAFYGCSGLTSIIIPDGVTSIGDDAFYSCYKLIEVYNKSSLSITAGSADNGYVAYYAKNVYTAEGGSRITDTADGFRFFYDGTEAYLLGYYGSETDITLPESFTAYDGTEVTSYSVYKCAFDYNINIMSVTIPDSVTSIGNYAFSYCSGLTSVIIGNNVTNIGDAAFSWCRGLTSINIPDSVISVGEYAFAHCSGLTSVIIGNNVTNIGDAAFSWCSGLTSINIPDSVINIGSGAFRGCDTLSSVDFDNVSGWQVDDSRYFYNGIDISAEDLSDAATAAKYVTSDYCDYYWKRV